METPDTVPISEAKLTTSAVLVSYKRRSKDAVFAYFYMNKKLSRREVQEKIDLFFRQKNLDTKLIKKIRRLAMKYHVRLGEYRRRFCKSCYSDLQNGKVRVSKKYKIVECECGEKNRWRL